MKLKSVRNSTGLIRLLKFKRASAGCNWSWLLGKSRWPCDFVVAEVSVEMFYKH